MELSTVRIEPDCSKSQLAMVDLSGSGMCEKHRNLLLASSILPSPTNFVYISYVIIIPIYIIIVNAFL